MRDKLLPLAYIGIGLLMGYLLSCLTVEPPIIYNTTDTTVYDTTIITWEYKPIITQEIYGTIDTLLSNDTTATDSLHKIEFTVDEGTADIDYNIYTRVGQLDWTPTPVRKEHTFQFESISNTQTIPMQQARFHKPSFTIGCVTGGVAVSGLVWLAGQLR